VATFSSNFSAILAQAGTGGAGTLAATLALGNTTGGNDIEFSSGDGIVTTANGAGAGFDLGLSAGDAGGGTFAGGDLNLSAGTGSGGGANGTINLNGDVVVTGSLTLPNLRSGTGSPEGSEVADVGAIYSRTDGGAGNAVYFKMSGTATNTGWVPSGPHAVEFFTASGSAMFTTGRAVFDDPLTLGVTNLLVFWNGVLQRQGATEDYTVVFGGASATITFAVTPPSGDFITIQYLPE
jgi:hypothetical protein